MKTVEAIMNDAVNTEQEILALKAQRDKLLEALVAAETVLRYLPDINTNWGGERATMTTRRAEAIVIAAIAKATGAARATEGGV